MVVVVCRISDARNLQLDGGEVGRGFRFIGHR